MRILPLCLFTAAFLLAVSCGCDDKKSVATKTGEKVGETLTDFAKGVGTGVDTRLEVIATPTQAVKDLGLQFTSTKASAPGSTVPGLSVYTIATQGTNTILMAKAFDGKGREIGRAFHETVMEKDDAAYILFTFPEQMDSQQVKEYALDIKK